MLLLFSNMTPPQIFSNMTLRRRNFKTMCLNVAAIAMLSHVVILFMIVSIQTKLLLSLGDS